MNQQTETYPKPRHRPDHPADQIEEWLTRHRLREFVRQEPELYEQHAEYLLGLLIEMHRSADRISEEMEYYARELESLGHSLPTESNSYQRAADTIRVVAQQRHAPPWIDVSVELEDRPQLSRLAHVLWEQNRRHDTQWVVSFEQVLDRVWTDPDPSPQSQIRPAASRLSNWMEEHAVRFTVSVDTRGRRFFCWAE